MNAAELIHRWDLMIVENRARLQALLDEAVAGSEPLVAAIGTDLTPLVLPWNTITPRVREACEEVASFWNQISDEMSLGDLVNHRQIIKRGCPHVNAVRFGSAIAFQENTQLTAR